MAAFDAARPTSYIIYLDANNRYGWAMSQPMPIGRFKWLTAAEAREIDWLPQTEDQPVGYFIEASMNYPVELHEAHNDYPLEPERLDLQVMMLSGKPGRAPHTLENVPLCTIHQAQPKPAAEMQLPGALRPPALLPRARHALV